MSKSNYIKNLHKLSLCKRDDINKIYYMKSNFYNDWINMCEEVIKNKNVAIQNYRTNIGDYKIKVI